MFLSGAGLGSWPSDVSRLRGAPEVHCGSLTKGEATMSEVASESEREIKKAQFLSRVCVRTIDHAVSVCGELVREFGACLSDPSPEEIQSMQKKARRVIDGINRAAEDLGIDDEGSR